MDFLSVQFFFYVLHLSLYIIDGNTFYCPFSETQTYDPSKFETATPTIVHLKINIFG